MATFVCCEPLSLIVMKQNFKDGFVLYFDTFFCVQYKIMKN